MKSLVLIALLILPISLAAESEKRLLTVEDASAFKEVSDPRVSPDGKQVAFVVTHTDVEKDEDLSNLYMVPVAGGNAVQITFSGGDEKPRWRPDGKALAFLSSRSGKEQVYVLNMAGGDAAVLTDVKQGVEDFEWSPDGKKLLLVITDADPDEPKEGKAPPPYVITRMFFKFDGVGYLKELYRHLYVFDVESRSLKQITSGPYDDADHRQSDSDFPNPPRWSPDGKQIAFVSNRTAEPDSNTNTDIYVVSADGGEPRKLTSNPGADQMPYWSPDGKSLVYVTSLDPKYLWFDQLDIATIPAAGGEPRILTGSIDRNAWEPRFGADGRVYFILEDQGTLRLVSMDAGGGSIREETSEKVVYDYDIGKDGLVAFTGFRPDLPGEVFVARSGKAQQLTTVNAGILDSVALSQPKRFTFKGKDGQAVEGFVFLPPQAPDGKKAPGILWIHGGPNEQETGEFDFRQQLLAAKGYAVIGINYRGSTGYGRKFQQEIYGAWGTKEIDDLMAGVDSVVAQGLVDPDRLAVGGHSYGAILTNYLITRTRRFKAAITDAGESNYLMNYGVDQYVLDWETEAGKPWENPQRYIELSPYFQLKNVTTPTLVVCGQEDWNVPLVNAEQLYLSLRRMGVDTMLLVYPEQPHMFWRPSYIRDRYTRFLSWYDKYLKAG